MDFLLHLVIAYTDVLTRTYVFVLEAASLRYGEVPRPGVAAFIGCTAPALYRRPMRI